MNQPKISVIIPAYNAQKYIQKCLDSIISQSFFSDLEVIVINDGSIDDTGSVVELYKSQYSNIKLINIHNSGVSKARNEGIKISKGEFISFIDADDWIDNGYFETVYKTAMSEEADIVATGFYINLNKEKQFENHLSNISYNKLQALKAYLLSDIDVHVVNKLFKKSLLTNISFCESISIAEDQLFLFQCLEASNKVVCLNKSYYHYYQNMSSAMNLKFSKKNLDSVIVAEKILKEIKKKYKKLLPHSECAVINAKCRLVSEIIKSKQKKEYNDLYMTLKKEINDFSLMKSLKYSSKKHYISLFIFKLNPYVYGYLRGNTFLKLKK